MCEKSGVEKRFFHHTEELLAAHPHFLDRRKPSLDDRLSIVAAAAPALAASAATKAIVNFTWRRITSNNVCRTHSIRCLELPVLNGMTSSGQCTLAVPVPSWTTSTLPSGWIRGSWRRAGLC
ncbi:hypothetical protein BRADI_1g48182v3 [Brachypodium distachyon]|uniref:Chalcone/stilbene synthase N-terminal domain-containing protein n=1 Tax=Brachypodium distachyon TaxID=15368 RepID=A0A2K2DQ91_BRADI|nr:hypothetical protein BRADI_1g48182v3 [Brachypodium distachyon]